MITSKEEVEDDLKITFEARRKGSLIPIQRQSIKYTNTSY